MTTSELSYTDLFLQLPLLQLQFNIIVSTTRFVSSTMNTLRHLCSTTIEALLRYKRHQSAISETTLVPFKGMWFRFPIYTLLILCLTEHSLLSIYFIIASFCLLKLCDIYVLLRCSHFIFSLNSTQLGLWLGYWTLGDIYISLQETLYCTANRHQAAVSALSHLPLTLY